METDKEISRRPLTQEERSDLRKKVLRGESLTLDEARSVYESLRQAQVLDAVADESKPKRGKKSAPMSDEALNASLDQALSGL